MIILSRVCGVLAAAVLSIFSIVPSAAALPEVTLDDFRARVHDWFGQHARESSLERLRNAAASAELNDLRWQLQVLLNRGESLRGLEDVGIHVREDGRSLKFDLERFPQWLSLERQVTALADPDLFRVRAPTMKLHGLSADNLEVVKEYLTNNDLAFKRYLFNRSLLNSYSRLIDADETSAPGLAELYFYESMHKGYELDHAWTVGLLEILDKKGQEAIESTFDHSAAQTMMAMGADGKPQEITARLIAMFRSPEFQSYMRKEEQKYSQPRSLDFSLEPPKPVEESQDPAWSYAMQLKLEQFFANHALADRFEVVNVDCRTTYCEIKAKGKLDAKPYEAFVQAASEVTERGWGLTRGAGGSGPNSDATAYDIHQVLRRIGNTE